MGPSVAERCCALVVEQYRALQIEKGQAAGQILSLLQSEGARRYLGMLDDYDQKNSEWVTEDVLNATKQTEEPRAVGVYSEHSVPSAAVSNNVLTKSQSGTSTECQEIRKKWNLSSCRLETRLVKSLRGMDDYTPDSRAALHSLTEREDCPELPESLWLKILSGDYVDLEHDVFEPKPITTGDGWASVWESYSKGLLFAFPRREREVHQYQKYILKQFSLHPVERVLAFDKRSRDRVAKRKDLLLTDFLHLSS